MDRHAGGYEVFKKSDTWTWSSYHKGGYPGFVHTKASGMATDLTSCQLHPTKNSDSREKTTEQHLKLQGTLLKASQGDA